MVIAAALILAMKVVVATMAMSMITMAAMVLFMRLAMMAVAMVMMAMIGARAWRTHCHHCNARNFAVQMQTPACR